MKGTKSESEGEQEKHQKGKKIKFVVGSVRRTLALKKLFSNNQAKAKGPFNLFPLTLCPPFLLMKYLDINSFLGINSLLDNLDIGESIVSGRIEAYSCMNTPLLCLFYRALQSWLCR